MSQHADPYLRGSFKESPYYAKKSIEGELVAILHGYLPLRELSLIKQISRALLRGEIHELILTDEDAGPGRMVNNIAYLGFVEITKGSVAVAGDRVLIGEEEIGTLAGFDTSHSPNHLNIVIKTSTLESGKDCRLQVGDAVRFVSAR